VTATSRASRWPIRGIEPFTALTNRRRNARLSSHLLARQPTNAPDQIITATPTSAPLAIGTFDRWNPIRSCRAGRSREGAQRCRRRAAHEYQAPQ
jgi:hypothetical protein